MEKNYLEAIKTLVFITVWLLIAVSIRLFSGIGGQAVFIAAILIGLVGILIFGRNRIFFWLFEFYAFAIFLLTLILLEFFGKQNLLLFLLSIINFASPFLIKNRKG
ncbi:MAG: hypothetical protein IJL56_09540 [Bacteroidales bacterium]|nr:hypothetical protein [Bacteroidales bacterium]